MSLDWNIKQDPMNASDTDKAERIVHLSEFEGSKEEDIHAAMVICIEKAISMLHENVKDESRYFLFEWDTNNASLNIVVTNDSKEVDSNSAVRCTFPALKGQSDESILTVRYWIRDYLTTCAELFRYSLISVFHHDNRANTELL